MSLNNVFDDSDIRLYDEFISGQNGADIGDWDGEFRNDLEFYPDLIHDDLGAIVEDLDLKCSPNSSDSGNYSPTSSSDCFNASDSWTLGMSPYENGCIDESPNSSIQAPIKQTINYPNTHQNLQNSYVPTTKLTPIPMNVVTNVSNYSNTPTFYTTSFASSSNSTVMVRPLETITLVPATVSSTGQTFVLSAPTLKLAPIQKTIIRPPPTPSVAPSHYEDNLDTGDDEYKKKMEDRRLRNRAAAQASRHRKRLQMDTMKDQLTECETECMTLRQENENLRKRVAELEKANELLMSSQNGGGNLRHKKAKTVTGVALAMCALIFTFSGSLPSSNTSYSTDLQLSNAITVKDSPEYLYLRRHGRSLAEVPDYETIPDQPEQVANNKTIKMCSSSLNATEKMRLNNDINNWIDRHTQMNFVELRQGLNPFLIHNSPKANSDTILKEQLSNSTGIVKLSSEDRRNVRLQKRISKEKREQKEKVYSGRNRLGKVFKLDELNDTLNNQQQPKGYQIAVRSELESRLMEELAAAIKQRDDILYLVTMKDYFLMPMIQRNATNSPKLSIVIPALGSSNSSNPKQIQMLQIDCIVSSTRKFYLPDTLVSLFNKSEQN